MDIEQSIPKIKIIDFNAAQEFGSEDHMMTKIGLISYRAPETLKESSLFYTKEVDLWSLGAILAFILL